MTVYSHEVGLAKPDPAIFLLTCDRLGVEPSEVVFVDNLPANVATAREVGMAAVLHQRTADTIEAVDHLLKTEARVDVRPLALTPRSHR